MHKAIEMWKFEMNQATGFTYGDWLTERRWDQKTERKRDQKIENLNI